MSTQSSEWTLWLEVLYWERVEEIRLELFWGAYLGDR